MCQQKDTAGREVGGVKTASGRGTDSRAAELTDIGEGWVSSLEATVRNKVDSDSTFRPRGTIRGAWGKNVPLIHLPSHTNPGEHKGYSRRRVQSRDGGC